MEQKKHPKVNLERKRGIYSAIGLLMAATFVLAALEFRTISNYEKELGTNPDPFENKDIIESLLIYVPKVPDKPHVSKVNKMRSDFLIDENIEEEPLDIIPIDVDDENNLMASVDHLFIDELVVEEEIPIIIPQVMPQFKGGTKGMNDFLKNNIRYPYVAQRDGKEGKVYLTFIIEKDGSISNIKILNDGPGGGCGQEAMRVVSKMPNWIPGEQFGKKVRVKCTLPINFRLN